MTEQGRALLQTRSAGARSSSISGFAGRRLMSCSGLRASSRSDSAFRLILRQTPTQLPQRQHRLPSAIGSADSASLSIGQPRVSPAFQGSVNLGHPTQWLTGNLYQQLSTRLTLGQGIGPGPPDRSLRRVAAGVLLEIAGTSCGIRRRCDRIDHLEWITGECSNAAVNDPV